MKINKKNEGRHKELISKLKALCDRYESIFDKPLTTDEIEYYLEEEYKRDRLQFLRDRMGVLSQADIVFLKDYLSRNTVTKELPPELHEGVSEIEEDEDLDFDAA